jgi:hypothetical protein
MYKIGEGDTSIILDYFNLAYPDLIKLGALISVDHIVEDDTGPCDYYVIRIIYPFIFDVRIVSKKYKSHKIPNKNSSKDVPSMFYCDTKVFFEALFSLGQFKNFEEENIANIRQRLLQLPELKTEDAVNELTDCLEKFIEYNDRTKKKRFLYKTKPEDFFHYLLAKIYKTFK